MVIILMSSRQNDVFNVKMYNVIGLFFSRKNLVHDLDCSLKKDLCLQLYFDCRSSHTTLLEKKV